MSFGGSFFGSSATVKRYRITGSDPVSIVRSISAHGPYSEWLGGRAEGSTAANPAYRFAGQSDGYGSCAIVTTASPAIVIGYVITLPSWKPGSGTRYDTVTWWNTRAREVAIHERRHVELFRAGQKKLNSTLASSTCADVSTRLNAVWRSIQRQQCEFDMAEYGSAAGLSLQRCVSA